MAHEVKIPSLGESVTEATLGRWLKQDGEAVQADEPILELESDKANMELAAEASGRLRILTPAGATVHFGDVVATIEEGAGAAAAASASSGSPAARAPAADAIPAGEQAPASATPPPQASSFRPRAASAPAASAIPPAAAADSTPPAAATASGPTGATSAAAAIAAERPLSPAVRRIVEEERLDLSGVRGTGPAGRITKGDALELAQQRAPGTGTGAAAPSAQRASVTPLPTASGGAGAAASARRPAPAGEPAAAEERVPMSRVRQVIARRLVESQQTTATLTTFNEVDMSAVMALRARYKEPFQHKHGVALGFMSFFVAACCEAMRDVPEANARVDGNDIVYFRDVHVGVAVGTDRGLIVPVVRNADRLSFAEVEREIGRLAGLARDNKLVPDDLSGATFTISNGGIYGSLLSTPILNPPQSAILGMHKIEKRPVVVGDDIVVRPMMYLALSYDHRLIDGKGAVTYLVRVKERLEEPDRLLLRL
ncbi:MAG TPA: 2-oxoglutarate dehydrogenase complex dihydrolipoyllysine-residue succinyltransferase [Candidatus Binatia bacterium]|nr:2-oxoglutarate dehydrogenase complex dihydrolipoyllysine-residue succinyltransferase [Candidatus Binatia bacterium]